MWKNEYEHFQVSLIDNNQQGANKYKKIHEYTWDEAKARSEYEKACKEHGLAPYPTAEDY